MHVNAIRPILNVTDVPASILWFEKLGFHRGMAWNAGGGLIDDAQLENEHGPATFGSVCANSAEEGEGPLIFLCRDAQGKRDPDPTPDLEGWDFGAVWMSWWVDDVDAAHAECVRHGVTVVRPPMNESWGIRECLVLHPDGHCFRISGPVTEGGDAG